MSLTRSQKIAVIVAAVALVWILSGQIFGTAPKEKTAPQAQAVQEERVTVQTINSTAVSHAKQLKLHGKTQHSRMVEVKSEIEGPIREIHADRGAFVNKGDLIAEIDIQDRRERLEEARATLKEKKLVYEASERLQKEGYRSESQLARALAEIKRAEASVKTLELEISNTRIKAPFGGVLNTRPVEVGDFVSVGDPIGTIVDLNPLYVIGEVSETNVGSVSIGQNGRVKLVTGETAEGFVRYISSQANERTRTFRIEFQIDNPNYEVPDGLTAEIILSGEQVLAHEISPAMLTLSDEGVVGVKVVDRNNIVNFMPIMVVDDSKENSVWITGLDKSARIISVGQEFVQDGEEVVIANVDMPPEPEMN